MKLTISIPYKSEYWKCFWFFVTDKFGSIMQYLSKKLCLYPRDNVSTDSFRYGLNGCEKFHIRNSILLTGVGEVVCKFSSEEREAFALLLLTLYFIDEALKYYSVWDLSQFW
jgi:hypothetical protein